MSKTVVHTVFKHRRRARCSTHFFNLKINEDGEREEREETTSESAILLCLCRSLVLQYESKKNGTGRQGSLASLFSLSLGVSVDCREKSPLHWIESERSEKIPRGLEVLHSIDAGRRKVILARKREKISEASSSCTLFGV